jgi:hypothetical protein
MKKYMRGLVCACIMALLAIVAALMPLLTGIEESISGTILGTDYAVLNDIKGFDLIFGSVDSNGNVVYAQSISLLIGWIFLIAAAVAAIGGAASMFGGEGSARLGSVVLGIGGLLAVAGGVIFLFGIPLAGFADKTDTWDYGAIHIADATYAYSLGLGYWLTAGLGILGGLFGFAPAFIVNKRN